METVQKISQAVSLIPIIVAIVVLYVGGSAGSWFIVEEYYAYSATDEDSNALVHYSDYNYYLNEVDNVVYVATVEPGGLEAYDYKTGKFLWRKDFLIGNSI